MKASDLPSPPELRRRHEALIAVENLVSGGDDFRSYGSDPPNVLWFSSGSGDEYRLAFTGDDALLTIFDHEAPQSPWGRDDGAPEWPGMFDGLRPHLRALLPTPEDDEPMSVSACFWFTDGAWHMGDPEPIPDEGDVYDEDPGGAAGLLASLLDPEAEVRELVGDVYEQPERVDEALQLLRRLDKT